MELFNTAACTASLGGVVLELINGSDGKVYASYPLEEAGPTLAAGARLVVGDPGLLGGLGADVLTFPLKTVGLQNGPDGVRLTAVGHSLDGLAYEGAVANTGEGKPAGADEAELAFARCPDGFDSDDNALDFQLRTPTPGAPNACQ